MITSQMVNLLSTKTENISYSDNEQFQNVSNFI